jgi:hypothetical protein
VSDYSVMISVGNSQICGTYFEILDASRRFNIVRSGSGDRGILKSGTHCSADGDCTFK